MPPALVKDYSRRASMADNSDRAYMADRIREVDAPAGSRAPVSLRMEIRDGDTPSWDAGKGNERVEQQGGSIITNGRAWTIDADVTVEQVPIQTTYDRWYIGPWQLHGNDSGQPFLSVEIIGSSFRLRAGVHQGGKNLITWPLDAGTKHRISVRFVLTGTETGFVELWLDGKLVKRFDNIRTGTGGPAYLKRGQYRNAAINGTGVITINALQVLDGSVVPFDETPPPPPPDLPDPLAALKAAVAAETLRHSNAIADILEGSA